MNEQYSAFVPDYKGPLIIDWAPGNLCNFSCKYCTPANYDGSEPWHNGDDSIRFLDYIYETICKPENKPISITLQGGEPTLWPHLDQVCKHLKQIDKRNTIRMLTNGTRGTQWWLDRQEFIDCIIVSIHNRQTKKDVIAQKFNAVELSGIDISMHVMIDVNYFDECIDLYNHLYNNIQHIHLEPKVCRLDITKSELQNYSEQQLETIKSLKIKRKSRWGKSNLINPPMYWVDNNGKKLPHKTEINKLIINKQNTWENWFCNIGLETLVITKEGRYKAGSMCFNDTWYGNIKDKVYNIPLYPVQCKYKGCFCGADIQVTKTRDIPTGTKFIDHDLSTKSYKITTRN